MKYPAMIPAFNWAEIFILLLIIDISPSTNIPSLPVCSSKSLFFMVTFPWSVPMQAAAYPSELILRLTDSKTISPNLEMIPAWLVFAVIATFLICRSCPTRNGDPSDVTSNELDSIPDPSTVSARPPLLSFTQSMADMEPVLHWF